jgi:Flp pilus assembly protein TadD
LTAVRSGDYRLWRCGTWEAGPSLGKTNQSTPTFTAFSRDGKAVFLNPGGGTMRMVETDSGRELAQFQSPFGVPAKYLTYCSESGRIITCDNGSISVWDLNAARAELEALGMPSELPHTPSRPPATRPLRLAVVLPDTAAEHRRRLGTWDRAVAANPQSAENYAKRAGVLAAMRRHDAAARDLDRAIELQPTVSRYIVRADCRWQAGRSADGIADLHAALQAKPTARQEATICNNLGWYYATSPVELRAADKAVTFATRAVRLAPDDTIYLNTLGVAYYRHGRFDEAIPHLRRSLRGAFSPAHDLFFLAMCYRKLEDRAKAQDCYDQACYWMSGHADKLPPHMRTELEAIQREAQLTESR